MSDVRHPSPADKLPGPPGTKPPKKDPYSWCLFPALVVGSLIHKRCEYPIDYCSGYLIGKYRIYNGLSASEVINRPLSHGEILFTAFFSAVSLVLIVVLLNLLFHAIARRFKRKQRNSSDSE